MRNMGEKVLNPKWVPEADDQKGTQFNLPIGRWAVLAVSAKCSLTSTELQAVLKELSLDSNVRGESPISLRVSIYLQASVTR